MMPAPAGILIPAIMPDADTSNDAVISMLEVMQHCSDTVMLMPAIVT